MTEHSETIQRIAGHLAFSKTRFINDAQIGALRRMFGATRDEVRAGAIIADRIRRRRQFVEGRPGFSVAGLVDMDAPIILQNPDTPMSPEERAKVQDEAWRKYRADKAAAALRDRSQNERRAKTRARGMVNDVS